VEKVIEYEIKLKTVFRSTGIEGPLLTRLIKRMLTKAMIRQMYNEISAVT
jgi:hypothetical protein